MRELERIERITSLINEIWKLNSDMRFVQLVQFLVNTYNEEHNGNLEKTVYEKEEYDYITSYRKTSFVDGFYLEDDKFEKFLDLYLQDEIEVNRRKQNEN